MVDFGKIGNFQYTTICNFCHDSNHMYELIENMKLNSLAPDVSILMSYGARLSLEGNKEASVHVANQIQNIKTTPIDLIEKIPLVRRRTEQIGKYRNITENSTFLFLNYLKHPNKSFF